MIQNELTNIYYQFFCIFHHSVVDTFSFKTVADSGGSGTSHPKSGTQFTISSSGIYLSSISSEDQAPKYELKNVGA